MKLGLAFDLKSEADGAGKPDDWQEEFDSPATVAALRRALESLGHTVVELGDGRGLIERLLRVPPELVFNIAEGTGISRCREARVPAVCELLGVAYTGSDPLTLAATLDKDVARRLAASAGVRVPNGWMSQRGEIPANITYPAIVKPAWEGSSKGVRGKCVVHNDRELASQIGTLSQDYRQPILIEEFIVGDEVTVGVIGNDPPRVLGAMQVVPKQTTTEFVYSLEVKRDWENRVRYECPPVLPSREIDAIHDAALLAYRALGCQDISRIDFRVRDGEPFFLEINPLPGLHPETGDIVLIARAMGMSHTELVGEIVDAARARCRL